jgi:hypothetical protein
MTRVHAGVASDATDGPATTVGPSLPGDYWSQPERLGGVGR